MKSDTEQMIDDYFQNKLRRDNRFILDCYAFLIDSMLNSEYDDIKKLNEDLEAISRETFRGQFYVITASIIFVDGCNKLHFRETHWSHTNNANIFCPYMPITY